jgi:hypothetical protein
MHFVKQHGFGAGESFETIAQHEGDYTPGIRHDVSISAYKGHLLVVIDGEAEFEWEDPAPLPAGRIALETLTGRIRSVSTWPPS